MDTNGPSLKDMPVYESKNPFVKNIFLKRIQTAINFAEINDRSIILDLGCDTGLLLRTIRKFNSQCECWGIDLEPKIMTLKIPNCTFKVGDARSLPLPDSYFTSVFVLDILEHIQDAEVAIKEIQRVLVPNGHAILSGPTESWFYRLCRFIEFGKEKVPSHFHTIHSIKEKFITEGFKEVKSQSLPGTPIPTLFIITKFQKISSH
jgi:ubiquinone/menaquinone biosynthesis C-methylase UbiE